MVMGGILLRKDRLLWSPKSARSGATTGADRDEQAYSGQKAAGEIALIIITWDTACMDACNRVEARWWMERASERASKGASEGGGGRWVTHSRSMGVIWYDGM